MKRKLLTSAILSVVFSFGLMAQSFVIKDAVSLPEIKDIPTKTFPQLDMQQINQEDVQRDRQGFLYRIGVTQYADITLKNSGVWKTNSDGSREWTLHVVSPGAEAISFLFDKFVLYGGTTLDITDLNGKKLHKSLTSKDVESHHMFNANLCFGDDMILVLREPAYATPSVSYTHLTLPTKA